MQSIVENFCRCFGSNSNNSGQSQNIETVWSDPNNQPPTSSASTNATPDMKRRTRSLALKDKQWDALFESQRNKSASKASPPTPATDEDLTMEQAHAVAKAKLEANRSRRQKRKRSPDHIFRSKEPNCETSPMCGGATTPNPFSRFLSRNPAIANSLCFANPVHDSHEEPASVPLQDENSVVSGGEETITSTLYYEQVKLAGLQQKNPPMPLFNRFSVQEGDELKQVVANETHSSAALEAWMKSNPSAVAPVADLESDSENEGDAGQDPDDVPPPMTKSSSGSSAAKSVR